MLAKLLSVAVAASLVLAITTQVARADDEVHEGKVVSVSDGKLTVLDKRDSDNDTFVVTAETKISRNGKAAKLSDIQAGDMAKVVATSQGEMLIAKQIIAAAPE
jgi:hypothetical protein